MNPNSATAVMNANIAPSKSVAIYFKQYSTLVMKPIRSKNKTAKVCAMYAILCSSVDVSSAGHIESHVIIRRVEANGCIFDQMVSSSFKRFIKNTSVFALTKHQKQSFEHHRQFGFDSMIQKFFDVIKLVKFNDQFKTHLLIIILKIDQFRVDAKETIWKPSFPFHVKFYLISR